MFVLVLMFVLVMIMMGHRPQVGIERGLDHDVPDLALQRGQFAWIEGFNLIIFIDHLRQFCQFPIGTCASHRWNQMIDNGSMDAPFGLHPFTRIVDSEGVDYGQISKQLVWIAILGETHAFAGQPLQCAMFPQVDDRVGIPALSVTYPAIQGMVVMCWG